MQQPNNSQDALNVLSDPAWFRLARFFHHRLTTYERRWKRGGKTQQLVDEMR